jgi:hypothetical protein
MASIWDTKDWKVERDAAKAGWEVNSEILDQQWFVLDCVLEALLFHMIKDVEHPLEKEYLLRIIQDAEKNK